MNLEVTGPSAILERHYSVEFIELVGHIERHLKGASMTTYDGESFVEVDLALRPGDPLYPKYSHRDPCAIPCDKFLKDMVEEKYLAAGWYQVQEYRIGTLRFYFQPVE